MYPDRPNNPLLEHIALAFQDVPNPGAGRLLRSDAGWEGQSLEPLISPGRWQDIPMDVIKQYPTALLLLTPEGFRFCLPAYLLAALGDPDEVDVLPQLVFMTLTPSGIDWNRNRLLEQVAPLTRRQWDAARSFVLHHLSVEHSYPAEQHDAALSFWPASVDALRE